MKKRLNNDKGEFGSSSKRTTARTRKSTKSTSTSRRSGGSSTVRNDASGDGSTNRSTDGRNDVSWYTNNMALVANAGNFSFNNAAGAVVPGILPNGSSRGLSGVCEYVVQMLPGLSDGPFSPINIAARALYDRVNYKNSRNFTYDAPDLMMYVYGVSSAYAYWAWMVRVYGILNTYSQINRYVPDTLIRATGADPDSIRLNMAQFRYYINLYARKVNVLAVPTGMPLFNRYMWLFSNVYMDADNVKAGLYISKPYGFFKYVERTTSGGACITVPFPKEFMNLDDMISYGNNIVEALLASQDINNMSTDILKAFEGNVMSLPDVSADYYVTPVYSEEVLSQIHNMRAFGDYVIGGTSTGSDGVVTVSPSGNLIQDPTNGYLSFEMELSDAKHYNMYKDTRFVLDSSRSNPSPEDVFVMTRFTSSVDKTTAKLQHAGSDVVLKLRCWWTGVNASKQVIVNKTEYFTSYFEVLAEDAADTVFTRAMTDISHLDKFDYCPLVFAAFIKAGIVTNSLMFNDVFNYTSIGDEELRKLHEAAILSMFTIPGTLGA